MTFNPSIGKYFQLKMMLFLVLLIFGWLLFAYAGLVYKSYTIDSKKEWFEGENSRLTGENYVLGRKFAYFQTDEFLIREAKRKLNKRESGESVLVLLDEDSSASVSRDWWHGFQNSTIWWEYFFGRTLYDEVIVDFEE
jgi:hypothetical protein